MTDQSPYRNNPIRSLHFVGTLHHGGIECWLMNLLRLRRPEIQFDFLTHAPGKFDAEAESLGATVHRNSMYHYYTYRDHWPLRKMMEQGNYDVVHIHAYPISGPILRIAAECGIPVRIDHSHNTSGNRGGRPIVSKCKRLYRQWIDMADVKKYATALLGCSGAAGRFSFGKYWETKETHKVVYCGIPVDAYNVDFNGDQRRTLCRRYGVPEDALVVGTIGSLSYQKNQSLLISAFAELAKRDHRYFLFIAGEGKERSNLERQVRESSPGERIIMPGVCNNVADLICHLFDSFCLPSRFEGLPVVLMESLCGGLHNVCSDVITEEITGRLPHRFTTLRLRESVTKWADALEESLQKKIPSREGVALIRQTPFTIENSMNSLLETYRRGLEG